jgi:hypothetical protein
VALASLTAAPSASPSPKRKRRRSGPEYPYTRSPGPFAERREVDEEQDQMLKEEEQRIQQVLDENGIVLSDAAWDVVWGYAVWGVHPYPASLRLSEDDVRAVDAAFDALLDPNPFAD